MVNNLLICIEQYSCSPAEEDAHFRSKLAQRFKDGTAPQASEAKNIEVLKNDRFRQLRAELSKNTNYISNIQKINIETTSRKLEDAVIIQALNIFDIGHIIDLFSHCYYFICKI